MELSQSAQAVLADYAFINHLNLNALINTVEWVVEHEINERNINAQQ